MLLSLYLWVLGSCVKYGNGNFHNDFEDLTNSILFPSEVDRRNLNLPMEVEVDRNSKGCICRATKDHRITVCFGNYECRKFPKINKDPSEVLRVRTTVIVKILKGELDRYYYLTVLDIEANHKLTYIEPGAFSNLTKLQHLSISYNTKLLSVEEKIFEGLVNLRNLTLVNNGFTNILQLTAALRPNIIPSLRALDLSENPFEVIQQNAFEAMKGTLLKKLDINLCRLEYVHPNSFLPLRMLIELNIGDNDVNSTLIGEFLIKMKSEGIKLIHLNLSGMGFRKRPPRNLLEIIAQTTVRRLILTHNQFEVINDDSFPRMANLELLDLSRVLLIYIGPFAFNPVKFPNLKILLLSGNNLPGIHSNHLSDQLMLLDLSNNKGNPSTPVYYEIDRDTFLYSVNLRVLNLAFNRIKSILDYTFRGLENLKILSLENGTLYQIGAGTFKPTKHLQILNLANNPLTEIDNFTSSQFEGLNELKVLIMTNCGIKRFYEDDNIFEMMPNLTHLLLRNNQLYYITAETLKPLKSLQVLDLSQNLIISWWRPLFLASAIKPRQLYLTNNRISQFSMSMIQDISYLLESSGNRTEIDLNDNIFVCDCNAMYTAYLWLEVNGSVALKKYFATSNFQCSSPDVWEARRVADYLSSINSVHCSMYKKISNMMVLVWTAPSLILIAILLALAITIYKYRIYIRYWIFLAKVALGRKFIKPSLKAENVEERGFKYDAFVSYCFEDRDFVVDMISELESNPPHLKLCVSERDFEIGSFISEAILTSINESRYVVLVISNNFAKSQWCRWETQLAEYHRLFLDDGTKYDPLVLIRIGDVENKYLTPTLKYLLKTKIYLLWNENSSEDFWQKLRNVLVKKK